MKNFILIIVAAITFTAAQSQTMTEPDRNGDRQEEINSLFNNIGDMGWWISPDFAWTKFNGKDGFLGGMSGGVILNHSYSIGGALYGIIPSQNLRFSGINDTADVYLYGGYGGLKLEYRLNSLKLFNIAFPLLIGGGGIAYSTWGPKDWYSTSYDKNYDNSYIWDSFFVIEPGVAIGINILKFMRLDAGVSYRFTSGIDLPETGSDNLNSLNVNLSLKFGKF